MSVGEGPTLGAGDVGGAGGGSGTIPSPGPEAARRAAACASSGTFTPPEMSGSAGTIEEAGSFVFLAGSV